MINFFSPSKAIKGLKQTRKLGQSFIFDPAICNKIVSAAGDLINKTVFEVGHGPGSLTKALLESGAKQIISFEIDKQYSNAIKPLIAQSEGKLISHNLDILKVNFSDFALPPYIVVANLPYTIATKLLINWLPELNQFEKLVLMFQKEVADRLCAKPKTKDYGRLSVLVQLKANVQKVMDLSPGCFFPKPKIKSCVVLITPNPSQINSEIYSNVDNILKKAFSSRRKMLKNNLNLTDNDLKNLNLLKTVRAEELSPEDYIKINEYFYSRN